MKREALYVRSIVLTGLWEYFESRGGKVSQLGALAKLDMRNHEAKTPFCSWQLVCDLFEKMAQVLDDPYFGLKSAMESSDDFRASGPNILLAISVRDVREFLDLAIKYQVVHTNGIAYSYREDIERQELVGEIDIHPMSPPCRQYLEHIVGSISQMGQRYLLKFPVKKVSFQHRAPKDLEWYKKVIGCEIEFNADKTKFIATPEVLDIKLGMNVVVGRPILRSYLKYHLSQYESQPESIEMTVSQILPSLLGVNKSDLPSVASFMELSPKKLQRLLKHEATSYSQILDTTRQALARRLLFESDVSIARIAGMLDYNSTEALIAASQRWFGVSPGKYRSNGRKR